MGKVLNNKETVERINECPSNFSLKIKLEVSELSLFESVDTDRS